MLHTPPRIVSPADRLTLLALTTGTGPVWRRRQARSMPRTARVPQIDTLDRLDQLPGRHPLHRAEYLLMGGQVDAGEPVEPRGKTGLRDPHHLGERGGTHRAQPRRKASACG
jgi:hypothetical protein